tara:strand:+ start:47581 stop:48024 length:444 start_codon:yes stop_codon:yes gene_type:complete
MSRTLFEEINLSDHVEFQVQLVLDDSDQIQSAKVFGIGGHHFLEALREFRTQLKGSIADLVEPQGIDMCSMLMREMVLRLKGKWTPPYTEPNICHCRAVATKKVDQAILYGAHTAGQVSKQTSSSTSCGTCREDVESLINFRKGITS